VIAKRGLIPYLYCSIEDSNNARIMKKGIHPEYNEVTVVLSDGSEIVTRSTIKTKDGIFKSEVDSKNHPFYNKDQKIQKKADRIDRFNKRYGKK
jgi:large subunit ribosomal protein L31